MLSRIFGPLFFATVCIAIGFYVGAVVGGSDPGARATVRRLRAWTGYWLEHRSQSYQQAGQRIYEDRCSVCHGITAGDAAELGRRSFRDYTEMGIYRVIANGQGQGDMPAYSRVLSERQKLQAVAYLKSLTEHAMSPMANLGPLPDGEYEYVATDGGVLVYSIDAGFQLVRNIRVVGLREPRGIAVHAESGRLYVPFPGEQSGREPVGRVVAIDLRTEQEVWRQHIHPGIDSLAVTPDGQKIYVPNGEGLDGSGGWTVLDAESGSVMTRISFGRLAHNTQVSQDGSRVYLASVGHDGMGIVDVASDEVIGEIGPFGGVIRPFALTGDGRFALVNVQDLSGFEVADLRTRQVIHRVQVEGWPWTANPDRSRAQSHGIALSPDEREAWVADASNRRMHVFDISALPARPVQGANIKLANEPKWMRFTRDGRWMHVSTGEIVNAKTHEVVTRIIDSRYYVQVSWNDGEPVDGYSRYGNGYSD